MTLGHNELILYYENYYIMSNYDDTNCTWPLENITTYSCLLWVRMSLFNVENSDKISINQSINQSISQSNPVLLKERVRIPRTRRVGGAAMLWGALPLDGVGSWKKYTQKFRFLWKNSARKDWNADLVVLKLTSNGSIYPSSCSVSKFKYAVDTYLAMKALTLASLHLEWNETWDEFNSSWFKVSGNTRWNCYHLFNSLWPTDIIWWHRSGPTFAQEMACCLMAPSHYLNQCWLIIKGIVWPSTQSNFMRSAHELLTTSLRGQWVNSSMPKGNKELSEQ